MKKIVLVLLVIFIASCVCEKENYNSSTLSKKTQTTMLYEGKITIVGNEPFTSLALMVNDTTVYRLECDEKTKTTLLKNQGQLYKIFVAEKSKTNLGTKLTVAKVEKLNR